MVGNLWIRGKEGLVNLNNVLSIKTGIDERTILAYINDKDYIVLEEYPDSKTANKILCEISKCIMWSNGEDCTYGDLKDLIGTYFEGFYIMPRISERG